MSVYFSTFISGFDKVIETELKKIPWIQVKTILDGLVVYESDLSPRQISKIKFFNNSFVLLSTGDSNLVTLLKKADLKSIREIVDLRFRRYFRVVVSLANQTVPLDPDTLKQAEQTIARQLGLKAHRTKPDVEFWFLIRSEGKCFFGVRFTPFGGAKTRTYEKGELRYELAFLLVLLSKPNKEDVVLDPFAGSGAIVLTRVSDFPYKGLISGDIDTSKVESLKKKLKWGYPKIKVEKLDALNLVEVGDNSINKIITDPPWGIFEKPQEDMVMFYRRMLFEFFRILRPDGIAVILVGRDSGFETALLRTDFLVNQKLDILVSGKKASIYRLSRSAKKAEE